MIMRSFFAVFLMSAVCVVSKAMAQLLSLLCECVVWLADDGDTVVQSDDAFDGLARQQMQGGLPPNLL